MTIGADQIALCDLVFQIDNVFTSEPLSDIEKLDLIPPMIKVHYEMRKSSSAISARKVFDRL